MLLIILFANRCVWCSSVINCPTISHEINEFLKVNRFIRFKQIDKPIPINCKLTINHWVGTVFQEEEDINEYLEPTSLIELPIAPLVVAGGFVITDSFIYAVGMSAIASLSLGMILNKVATKTLTDKDLYNPKCNKGNLGQYLSCAKTDLGIPRPTSLTNSAIVWWACRCSFVEWCEINRVKETFKEQTQLYKKSQILSLITTLTPGCFDKKLIICTFYLAYKYLAIYRSKEQKCFGLFGDVGHYTQLAQVEMTVNELLHNMIKKNIICD